MNKPLIILILFLGIIIRIPLLNHNFISDDYISLAKTTMISPHDLFFRPIQTFIFSLNKALFGLKPLGWNLMSLFFHLVNIYLLIIFTDLLFNDKRITLLSGLLFSVHFIHNEPIFWFSAILTLITAFFLLLTVITYIKNRSFILPLIFFILALLTKETAVVIPFILLAIACYKKITIKHLIPYFIILAAYLMIRVGTGSPFYRPIHYEFSINPQVFSKNLTFLFSGLSVWIDYRFLHNIWHQATDAKAMIGQILNNRLILLNLTVAWAIFLIFGIFGNRKERFAVIMIITSFLPFLFLKGSGERFLYIPSIGFVFFLTLMLGRFSNIGQIILTGVLILYFSIFSLGSGQRWIMAGRQAHEIIGFLTRIEQRLPPNSRIIFINPPEDIDGAWVFKNGLEFVDDLYFPRKDVEVIPVKGPGIRINPNDKIVIWQNRVD